MIAHPLKAWNRFWFAPISAKPLGAFRILFGLIAIFNILLLFIDTDYWLTDHGLFQGSEAREMAGPLRPSILHWLQDPISVRVVLFSTLGVAVGVTLGWHTRIMSMLLYFGMLMIHHRNIATASGADVLVMVTSFYIMLSPAGAAYSFDARRAKKLRGGTLADTLIIPWAQRLIQIQLCIVYMTTAIFKTHGTTWLTGTALHYVLCNREIGRFDFSALAAYPILVNLMTYGGLATEFCLAFLLWSKAARPIVIIAGIGLHTGITLMVNIPVFGELATATYLVFLTSSEWEWLRTRFNLIAAMKHRLQSFKFSPMRKLSAPGPFITASTDVGLADS